MEVNLPDCHARGLSGIECVSSPEINFAVTRLYVQHATANENERRFSSRFIAGNCLYSNEEGKTFVLDICKRMGLWVISRCFSVS